MGTWLTQHRDLTADRPGESVNCPPSFFPFVHSPVQQEEEEEEEEHARTKNTFRAHGTHSGTAAGKIFTAD